jgi:hypothetical protein
LLAFRDRIGAASVQADLVENAFGFRRRLGSAREALQIDIDGCSPMQGMHGMPCMRTLANVGVEALRRAPDF